MKQIIKQLIKSGVTWVVSIAVRTSEGRYFLNQVLSAVISVTRSVSHKGVDLVFMAPNEMNHFRVDTFSSKEPETLEWIDEIPQGSVVWDIGANVGLYTCYAAKARSCKVFAFEPSVFNHELLARNIFLNGLTDQAIIIPLPLSDTLAFDTLNMMSTSGGGANSTFGQDYGFDGKELKKIFEFQTIGLSMVDAVKLLRVTDPDYIKMDVDGIEHLILKGGATVLQNIKGILIEINEDFEKQAVDSALYLSEAGLVLKEKRSSAIYKNSSYKNVYNQIWYRPLTR
jgi:FkbM family methyltransferase